MVASLAVVGPGSAAELGADGHQRRIEQSALSQIANQGRDRSVDPRRLAAVLLHVAVRVPIVVRAGVDQLDHAHAALHQSPCQQALRRERFSVARLDTVFVQRGLTFAPGQMPRALRASCLARRRSCWMRARRFKSSRRERRHRPG